ncbi:MAG: VPLPA-CTERM-specific exosortase XrtD [Gammaproteobacteria bacterium]|nr:VPLPA-CTERM-specific exosortase XrtD [Gammaproteobacteria bacterium]
MWSLVAIVALILAVLFWPGLSRMYSMWIGAPEYSHGILIPIISLYLIWQRAGELARIPSELSWLGVGVVVFGLLLFMAGDLATIYTVVQYAFLIVLYGVVLSLIGWRAFRVIAIPLLILAFMIPLPAFLYNNLSAKLQLLSSALGVVVIRLFHISVYLEGNVIDLGSYKLQVVEACNGLRYLFPLMTIGFIVAYFYHAALWKRAVIFLSTIPITVLMNSFRIGVIGIMVNYWGQSMAEGFLHDFEGWAVFMACFAVLFAEMWLLMRLTGDRRPLREVFGMEAPVTIPTGSAVLPRAVPLPFVISGVILALVALVTAMLPDRRELVPDRTAFAEFPSKLGDWEGQRDVLDQIYIDALKFTDYALINYHDAAGAHINFYSAYYESQRKGQSVHSPRSCLPGGGWEIQSLTQRNLEGVIFNGRPLRVNRALISYGDQKQVVYYWFQQRGRTITNEYLVKAFIFWDAITRNRTDGSLIRLTIAMPQGGDEIKLDAALTRFAQQLSPILSRYIPN